ncbi:class I SAM-dependent methyltransferase [Alkalihalophilus sp. As8PL]|uniref:Class I SAM-dependent methyltransferase n=1 Tax=Alkalihalophilus sp. As8PL TaxID=3237103 RepID=A0AB39BYZ8_9BACI
MNEEKEKVMKQFGANASKYVSSKSHAKGEDLAILVDWIKPDKEWSVLDIATGGGHVAKALALHVNEVFATDLTKAMLENTSTHLKKSFENIKFVIADAEKLPFLDRTFDVVTCRIAPHHFPTPKDFISEAARVLKPGGLFLMIDNVVPEDRELATFMNTFEKMRDESHVACLPVSRWESYLKGEEMEEVRSLKKKKTYRFPGWVERTTTSSAQVNGVHQYILQASKRVHDYFQVEIQSEKVASVTVDEWMILYKKSMGRTE